VDEYFIQGPLSRTHDRTEFSLFDEYGGYVQGQYLAIRKYGGTGGDAVCFLLRHRSTDEAVGFVGLARSLEVLQPKIVAYYSIDFVFLRDDLRGHGLGRHLAQIVQAHVLKWLEETQSKLLPGQELSVQSASSIESKAGRRFLEKVDIEPLRFANENGIPFHGASGIRISLPEMFAG
jgi:GNAT superfamily N-acetyltransferase